jgi:hypothetical protein
MLALDVLGCDGSQISRRLGRMNCSSHMREHGTELAGRALVTRSRADAKKESAAPCISLWFNWCVAQMTVVYKDFQWLLGGWAPGEPMRAVVTERRVDMCHVMSASAL